MKHHPFLPIFAIFSAIVIDQITKYEATLSAWNGQSIIGDWLTLKTVTNPGIAFSLPLHGIWLQGVTVFLWALMTYLLWYSYQKNESAWTRWGYACLVAGALGNAIDRLLVGKVVDFISLKGFAIFNFADMIVSAWVILLLISLVWTQSKTQTNSSLDLQK